MPARRAGFSIACQKLAHPRVLAVARQPQDLAVPSYRLHQLKGDLAGHWSVWVNGNWRVTFRFIGTDVEFVDYRDYR